jgi:hypothetical protein
VRRVGGETGEQLDELDRVLPALVIAALETAGSRADNCEVASSATARLRDAAGHLGEDAEHVHHDLREVFGQLLRRSRRPPEEGEELAGETAATETAPSRSRTTTSSRPPRSLQAARAHRRAGRRGVVGAGTRRPDHRPHQVPCPTRNQAGGLPGKGDHAPPPESIGGPTAFTAIRCGSPDVWEGPR